MEDKTTIAQDVLSTIARKAALEIEGVSRMCQEPPGLSRLFKRNLNQGVHIEIENGIVNTELYLVLTNGVNIRDVSRKVQQEVARSISEMVGMQVGRVDIHIEDIDYPSEVGA